MRKAPENKPKADGVATRFLFQLPSQLVKPVENVTLIIRFNDEVTLYFTIFGVNRVARLPITSKETRLFSM